jgi:hypothetical protein
MGKGIGFLMEKKHQNNENGINNEEMKGMGFKLIMLIKWMEYLIL